MNIKRLMFLAVLAFGSLVQAAPFDQREIAADAKWFVHADLGALRESQSAKLFVAAWLQAGPARRHLAGIREAIGLDIVQDLHSVTLYGQELVPDRGVVIVRASLDRARVMAFLARQPDYDEKNYAGRDVLTWTDGRGGQRTVFAAFHGESSMLFSRDAGDLAAALAVLDGQGANLAEGDSPLTGPAPPGTVLLVRARELSEAKLALKSPILRLSEVLTLAAGEAAGIAFVEVRLTAASAEHVSHFHDVAVGLVALARLMRAGDPDVVKLLDATTISTEDRTIAARWAGPLVDVLKAAGNEKRRKPAVH